MKRGLGVIVGIFILIFSINSFVGAISCSGTIDCSAFSDTSSPTCQYLEDQGYCSWDGAECSGYTFGSCSLFDGTSESTCENYNNCIWDSSNSESPTNSKSATGSSCSTNSDCISNLCEGAVKGACSGTYNLKVNWLGSPFDWAGWFTSVPCEDCHDAGQMGYFVEGTNWYKYTCVKNKFIICTGARWSESKTLARSAYTISDCNTFSSQSDCTPTGCSWTGASGVCKATSVSSTCVPNWTASDWLTCSNGIRTRTVTDLNNCNNISGKPATSESCNSTCAGSGTQSCPIANGTGTQIRICNSGTWSSFGDCNLKECNSGYANCDSNTANGCETKLGTNTNCASCGNVCSSGQACQSGTCKAASTTKCTSGQSCTNEACSCDDSKDCTTDTCSSGSCVYTNKVIASSCTDDGKSYTIDVCSAEGECLHTPSACATDNNECTKDYYSANGVCTHINEDTGKPCKVSNNECKNYICSSGACVVQSTKSNCDVNSIIDWTPRVAFSSGKAAMHTENGVWTTDRDGFAFDHFKSNTLFESEEAARKGYCVRVYGNSPYGEKITSSKPYKLETINGWKNQWNVAGGPFTLEVQTYTCVHGSLTLCGDGKIDVGENCSSCGEDVKCATGESCNWGVCTTEEITNITSKGNGVNCSSNSECISGNCTNAICSALCTPITNPCGSKNCGTVANGTCGNVTCGTCSAGQNCNVTGQCAISSCSTGYADCDSNTANGCEVQLGTAAHCANCTNVCITGQSCVNNVCKISEDNTTPKRIAFWEGKVNQHTENGVWTTDSNGISDINVDKLTYCKKFYPNTLSVRAYQVETITTWRNAVGTGGPISAAKQSYECVQPASTTATTCELGCSLSNGRCVQIGYRQSVKYCSPNGDFVNQIADDSTCDNNFECTSNFCVERKCISGTLIQKILSWFRDLFSPR